jgi:hypothetical protein
MKSIDELVGFSNAVKISSRIEQVEIIIKKIESEI